VAELLNTLRWAGTQDQVTALLDRDPAAHVPLDDPDAVAELLRALREAGARDQVDVLAGRAAAQVALDDPGAVARLLFRLQAPGTQNQADVLAGRLPAAGLFAFIVEQPGGADQYRFGREADGSPSEPWGWEDLDL
jgi:hypothetical protein